MSEARIDALPRSVLAPPRALSLAGLIAVALVAYWPSTAALSGFWEHQYLGGHGPLVAAISLWLIVRARRELARSAAQPSAWGFAGLILCSVASVIFWRASIEELQMLLLPLILFFAVLAALGGGSARILAFPIAYLYFAEPPWHLLTAPLQALTLQAVRVLAPLVGMPARVAGNLVHLPGGVTFEVTPLCSGVNFLVVGLAVAALIGELERAPLRRRAALLGSMAVLAVVGNWARVLIIMGLGYAAGMHQVLVTRGHVLFGWILFSLMMFAFAWFASRPHTPADDRTVPAIPNASLNEPVQGLVAAVALLLAAPILARAVPAAVGGALAPLALRLPDAPAGWRGPLSASVGRWKPEFVGAHSEWHAVYQDASGANVEVLAIGYPSQGEDRELVNEGNSLLGSGDFSALAAGTVTRGELPHIEVVASDGKERPFVLWSVYDIGGRKFVTPLFSQLWYGVRSLGGAPYSVLFAYRTECEPSCEAARARLERFMRSVGNGIVVSNAEETAVPSDRRVT